MTLFFVFSKDRLGLENEWRLLLATELASIPGSTVIHLDQYSR